MKIHDQYIIPFGGLKEGEHIFEFELKKEFFDEFLILETDEGRLNAVVKLTKRSSFLALDISVKGTMNLKCDRCLENYDQEMEYNGVLYIKFSENQENDDQADEVMYLHPDENEIDLKQYLYESISLSMPYKRVHPEKNGVSGCNGEMLKFIDSDKNDEIKSRSNPVWDKLKDLKQL